MRNSYHTQQRRALLAFLSAHADEQFTVEQLLAAMGNEAPGRSTVYRALDRLVEEGTVRRFAPEKRWQRGLSGHGPRPLRRAPAPQVRGLRAADPSG
ncbi:MAG: transcriptional repressor [Oscillospiraceae bacterium]